MLDMGPHINNSIPLSHDTAYIGITDVTDVKKVQLDTV